MANNVVVTGGGRGIGLGITQALVGNGYHVIAIARTIPAITPDGSSFLPWDLASIETLPRLATVVREQFGPVYGLVNNAGIGTSGVLATMPDAQIAQIMQINVIAPITLTKYLIRPMMVARRGRVVNISSVVASTGYSGLSVYGASKAAIVGFTRSLAREVGPLGITVNAIAPGFVDTGMTEGLSERQRKQIERRSALQRLITARDVASAVSFLLSSEAGNITGSVLTVDAGNTA
jgi:3-oxoacyl-[acyl-carrier protein] reductase